jgi:GT2 family glycosyltransferase
MLPTIDKQDAFRLTGRYRLIPPGKTDNGAVFLQHSSTGERVQTDHTGKRILETLPGTFAQLSETLKTGEKYISPRLTWYYLAIFLNAGIIERNAKEKPADSSPRTSEIPGKPSISAIIVTFNGEKFIRPNLESLYRQTLAPQEIIIVDNASTDRTLDIVKQDFNGVKIIKNKKNYHYARAVNTGVEAAQGELAIILNQDLVFEETFVEMLYRRYLEEGDKKKAAAVAPQMRFSKLPAFINGIGNFITEDNWGSDNYFGVVDIGQFDHLKYAGSACFGAVMVSKPAWQTVGPLDKTYKSFYEDTDWSIRAHIAGFNLLAAPKAIVYHEFGGSYPSGLKLKLVAKNRMRFVLKNLKGKLLKRFFKRYLKQDLRNALSFIRQGSYRNAYYYMRAYMGLLAELPNILAHRRQNTADAERIGRYFTKGAPYVAFSNSRLNPVIDEHTIRSYYYFTGMEGFIFPTQPVIY